MEIKTFAYHRPSKEGFEKITELRQGFSVLAHLIDIYTPISRERSVALTHLETAAMWAIKSVVCNDPASEVNPDVEPYDLVGGSEE